jgi:single-strand DNA-binding protein
MIQLKQRRKDAMNKAILIGNLGRDPQISQTETGTTIAKLSIATSDKWKDKKSGEVRDHTEWHRITAFGKLAEICEEYLFKGKQVCIEGRIQTSSWEKDGIKRFSTEIIASKMEMLGGKQSKDIMNPSETSIGEENSGQTNLSTEEDEIPF